MSSFRSCLLLLWAMNVFASIAFCSLTALSGRSSTRHRKFFHLTVSMIYTSGLFLDKDFTRLCAWLVFCIFVIIEVLRFHSVPPWGNRLNAVLLVFKDQQDGGVLMTPIYLLLGIFMPLLLDTTFQNPQVCHLAGVASVGVGDSLAAIVGSNWGRHHWPGKQKTMEGSAAMFVGVTVTLLIAREACSAPLPSTFWCILTSAVLTGIEAFVKNVDNVLLPIVGYFML